MGRALITTLGTLVLVLSMRCHSVSAFPTCSGGPTVLVQKNAPSMIVAPGAFVQAILVAVNDWNAHVAVGRFQLRDQTVTVVSTTRGLKVEFVPRRESLAVVGGRTKYGRDVYYIVDARTYHIICRAFAM